MIQQLNVGCPQETLDRHPPRELAVAMTNEDLLSLHEQELSDIKQLFSAKHPKSRDNRVLRNAFYTEQVRTKNRLSLSRIAPGSTSTSDICARVLKQAQEHPVASTTLINDFTKDDQIGFCFARAFLIHYLLHKEGVSPCNIYKIFAIGQMRVDYRMWHFHVAVVVRSIAGPIVIDPFFEQPVPLHEWTKEIEKLDIKFPYPRTRFYVTDARKLLPASGVYTLEDFMHPLHSAYFEALSATIGPSSGVSP